MSRSILCLMIFLVLGCGKDMDLCAYDKERIQRDWGGPPVTIEGSSWVYIEEYVAKYRYTFSEVDGTCSVKERVSFLGEDPFNPELPES